jgi:hypothetical protein
MPRYQGELDGLCGMYAIANAFEFAFEKDAQKSFQICCETIPKHRWPTVLWDGTTYRELILMIAACARQHKLRDKLTIKRPLASRKHVTNNDYWKIFDEALDRPKAQCAIIGVEEPSYHWIIATKHKSGILFLDSDANEKLSLMKRDNLYAGKRRPNKNLWRLNPRELVIFEKR